MILNIFTSISLVVIGYFLILNFQLLLLSQGVSWYIPMILLLGSFIIGIRALIVKNNTHKFWINVLGVLLILLLIILLR